MPDPNWTDSFRHMLQIEADNTVADWEYDEDPDEDEDGNPLGYASVTAQGHGHTMIVSVARDEDADEDPWMAAIRLDNEEDVYSMAGDEPDVVLSGLLGVPLVAYLLPFFGLWTNEWKSPAAKRPIVEKG